MTPITAAILASARNQSELAAALDVWPSHLRRMCTSAGLTAEFRALGRRGMRDRRRRPRLPRKKVASRRVPLSARITRDVLASAIGAARSVIGLADSLGMARATLTALVTSHGLDAERLALAQRGRSMPATHSPARLFEAGAMLAGATVLSREPNSPSGETTWAVTLPCGHRSVRARSRLLTADANGWTMKCADCATEKART